jgi:hypothetical protein
MHGIIFNLGTSMGSARTVGAYLIATHLRQEGWDIEVVDFARRWPLEKLKELCQSRIDHSTKFIGFSFQFSYWEPLIEDFCTWLKDTYPSIVLISGSSITPQYTTSLIDYHISGYGEYAVSNLLKYLFSNGDPIKFSLVNTGAKKLILANTFYQAYPKSSLQALYEKRDFIWEDEWLATEFSRGCKFACAFCNFPVLGVKGDYTRTADDFELEMRHNYDNFGVKNYIVIDETFNDSTDKITKYADVVEKLNFVPFYSGYIRGDLIVSRPKDREELLRMNFLGHWYGLETFDKTAGKAIGKGMDADRLKQGILDVKDYFLNNGRKLYRGNISLVCGLPGETIESLYQTKDWILNNWQGQSYAAWCLGIPIGTTDIHSKIAKDYKSYGYTELSAEEIANFDGPDYIYRQSLGTQNLWWKNEHMTMFDAERIAMEIENLTTVGKFRLDNWSIASTGFSGSAEERIAMDRHSEPDRIKLFGERINTYIDQKLNYKK